MLQDGATIYQVAEAIGCDPSTAWRWEQRFRAVDQSVDGPLLMDDWTRIARRSQQKMHDFLDYLDEHPEDIAKHALIPNVYAGTGTDKLQKAEDFNVRNRSNEAAHSLADAISRLASLDTSHLAGLIEGTYIEGEVNDA